MCDCEKTTAKDTAQSSESNATNCAVEQIKTAAAAAALGGVFCTALCAADIICLGGLGTLVVTGACAIAGWHAASESAHCKDC